eukprot:5988286-Prymnesium_polylepis.1
MASCTNAAVTTAASADSMTSCTRTAVSTAASDVAAANLSRALAADAERMQTCGAQRRAPPQLCVRPHKQKRRQASNRAALNAAPRPTVRSNAHTAVSPTVDASPCGIAHATAQRRHTCTHNRRLQPASPRHPAKNAASEHGQSAAASVRPHRQAKNAVSLSGTVRVRPTLPLAPCTCVKSNGHPQHSMGMTPQP